VGRFGIPNRSGILLWRPGWNSAPVYFSDSTASNRVGTFTKSNQTAPLINRQDLVKIPGDFDGDLLTDIMLINYASPQGRSILFSNGTGSYTSSSMAIMNSSLTGPEFNYAAICGSNPMVGRFNNGSKDDVLLWKSGWNSNPIMFGGTQQIMTAPTSSIPTSI
jgi:hypothetical protein